MNELLLKRWTAGWFVLVLIELVSQFFERPQVIAGFFYGLAVAMLAEWLWSMGGTEPLEPRILVSPVGLEILLIGILEIFAWRYIQLAPVILLLGFIPALWFFWPQAMGEMKPLTLRTLVFGLLSLPLAILWTAAIFSVLSPMAWMRPEPLLAASIFPLLLGLARVLRWMSTFSWGMPIK